MVHHDLCPFFTTLWWLGISFWPPSSFSGGYHSHHHRTGLVDIFLTTIILVAWNIFLTTLIVVNNPLHYHTLEFVMDIPHHHHALVFSGLEHLSDYSHISVGDSTDLSHHHHISLWWTSYHLTLYSSLWCSFLTTIMLWWTFLTTLMSLW